jgi:N-acetylglucosaminyldiphosphoundecaprenol N-acetyl-beta-D-mannosaminyltransferase
MNETLSIINDTIVNEESIQHVVVNAGKIVQIQKDEQLRESVNNSDIINADGQAVVWAAKFLNKPLKERVTGIDLMENLVELAYKNNHKIFLFGAKEEVVKEVVTIYTKKYNKNLIAGYRNGYYNKEDEASIAKEIASSGANMLFVAITFFTTSSLAPNKNIL